MLLKISENASFYLHILTLIIMYCKIKILNIINFLVRMVIIMKKHVLCWLILAVMLIFTACSSSTPGTETSNTPDSQQSTPSVETTGDATVLPTEEITLQATEQVTQGTSPSATNQETSTTSNATPAVTPQTTPEDDKPQQDTVSAIATRLGIKSGKVELEAVVNFGSGSGILELELSDASGNITQKTVNCLSGQNKFSIDCPAEKLDGELTLKVLSGKNQKLLLKLKNRLPQLTEDGINCVIDVMTDNEKAHLVSGIKELKKKNATGGTYEIARLGVPSVTYTDGPAGVRFDRASVWYPSMQNLAATWDAGLLSLIGQSIGEDALGLGMDMVLAPGMNIQKNILCGRNFEYCSEDPLLTAFMSAAYVKSLEETGENACIKHFAANSQETFRYTSSSNVTERALREIYLKAFGMVVEQTHPVAVMSSYNRLNGTHTSIRGDLLNGILRDEFGFDGLVMSDWTAHGDIPDKVLAGNDINMPGYETDAGDILNALKSGYLSREALNKSCFNLLKAATESPTFKGVAMDNNSQHRQNVQQHVPISQDAAAQSMILLKNDNSALPFKQNTSVAVFGNGAFSTVYGGTGSGSVLPTKPINILTGIETSDALSVYDYKNNIFMGAPEHSAYDQSKDVKVSAQYAQQMAAGADAAVIVISRSSVESRDRANMKGDLLLNDVEMEMINNVSTAFHAKGKKVVVIINTGSVMEVASWRDKVDGILYCGYAGQTTGSAVADVLSGKVNPSAKTTITWPIAYSDTPCADTFPGDALDVTYYEDIYVGYRYYSTFNVPVAYPFGYGLSYTKFEYSNYSLKKNADGTYTIEVTVKNTGSLEGREIVQAYVSKPETLQEQAKIELCGFAKTDVLKPGKSQTVSIDVPVEALITYDTANSRWIMDKGRYTFYVGASSLDHERAGSELLNSVVVVKDVENRCQPDTDFDYIKKSTYDPNNKPVKKENIALNKTATSNYNEDAYTADRAVDGCTVSRWSGYGYFEGNHIWQVDLGKEYAIGELEILWESIGSPFSILLSTDGVNFTKHKTYSVDETKTTFTNLYGKKARYIRLDIPSEHFISLFEFRAYEATAQDIELGKNELTNLALNKTVSASVGESAHPAVNAVDGKADTRWSAQYSGNAWLQVDLGKQCNIKAVELYLESAWNSYKIEYSTDGTNYTTLCSGKKDELSISKSSLNINARYVRVSRDGEGWFSIFELEIYG